jgi:hypothetical protein
MFLRESLYNMHIKKVCTYVIIGAGLFEVLSS